MRQNTHPAHHFPQVKRRPVGSSAAGTSVQATRGAHGVVLLGCGGLALQPSMSTQEVLPLPENPGLQAPQTGPDGESVQSELGSQPPLETAQDSVGGAQPAGPVPLPRSGAAQAPQVKPPGLLMQGASGWHGGCAAAHSFTSLQVMPSPENPGGHAPQRGRAPSVASTALGTMHCTPGKHAPAPPAAAHEKSAEATATIPGSGCGGVRSQGMIIGASEVSTAAPGMRDATLFL